MLTLTSVQLDALLVAWFYPLARILGMVGTAPIFSNRAVPMRIRLAVGLILVMAIAPSCRGRPQSSRAHGRALGSSCSRS